MERKYSRRPDESVRFRGVNGAYPEGLPFTVIDYAPILPDGFEKIFQYARKGYAERRKADQRIQRCGKRDKQKLKVLGELAEKYCDCIFLNRAGYAERTGSRHSQISVRDQEKGLHLCGRPLYGY